MNSDTPDRPTGGTSGGGAVPFKGFDEVMSLIAAGRIDDARGRVDAARRTVPGNPYVGYAAGLVHFEAGDAMAATESLVGAAKALVGDGEALLTAGTLLMRLGQADDAVTALGEAARALPGNEAAQGQYALALAEAGKLEDAAEILRGMIAETPGHPLAALNLALVQMRMRTPAALEEARGYFAAIVAADPGNLVAAFSHAVALPAIFADEDEIETWRRRYAEGLASFAESLDLSAPDRAAAATNAVFSVQNFHLPQQGRCDVVEQKVLGALQTRIAAARFPALAHMGERAPSREGRIRVAFVSAYFCSHSIWKTHGRWATRFDSDRFEVTAIHAGAEADDMTEDIRGGVERFVHHPVASVADAGGLAERIAAFAPDVVVYPDLGMSPELMLPASLRLAPVQAQGLGHPETSGLPSMDFAITSELMEPEGAEAHYSERLICLPATGFCYDHDRIAVQIADACNLPAPARRYGTVFLCSQNLSKLAPHQDAVFARLLAEVPDSELWLIARPVITLTEAFRDRIGCALTAAGVDTARLVMHPRMGQRAFLALNLAADVLLDGIGWSGCNTAFEAVAAGRVIVTLPGALMRGRHTYAILKTLGIEDSIAVDEDGYVEIAARLARDPAYRAGLEERVRAHSGRLFDDEAPVRALEDALTVAVAGVD